VANTEIREVALKRSWNLRRQE